MLLFQQGNNSRFLQQIYFKKKKKKLFRMCPALICVLSVQSQVDEVIDVMQENISKVIERGEHLDDLQDKSGESQCHTFFWVLRVRGTFVLFIHSNRLHRESISVVFTNIYFAIRAPGPWGRTTASRKHSSGTETLRNVLPI